MASIKVNSNVDLIIAAIRNNAEAALAAAGEIGVEAVQEKMLYGYNTPHGADGHTEIVDTGRLFDSITSVVSRESQNLVSVAVGTNVEYAVYVHEGTYKLESRPFIRDGMMDEETQKKMETAIIQQIANGL